MFNGGQCRGRLSREYEIGGREASEEVTATIWRRDDGLRLGWNYGKGKEGAGWEKHQRGRINSCC